MKKSVKFKDYKFIQKIGYILLIIASAMTLANMFDILKASHFVEEDLRAYIFLIGGILVMFPFITKHLKRKNISKKTTVFLLMVCACFGARAQDYSKQIKTLVDDLT